MVSVLQFGYKESRLTHLDHFHTLPVGAKNHYSAYKVHIKSTKQESRFNVF